MLTWLIRSSLANRATVVVASALLLIAGGYVASDMEVDVFPDLTAPTVVVLTEAHGLAPEEVEALVTFPLETAVNGATHVRRVRSSSSAGISILWVEFEWDTDIFRARQIVTEKIAGVGERLPDGVSTPVLAPQSSIMGEIMLLSVTADSTNAMDLRTLADWAIRPRLLGIGGVAQVVVIGGGYREYQILASPERMARYGVTLDEVMDAGAGSGNNASGGFLNAYGNEYRIKSVGRTTDLQEMGRTLVKEVDGRPITLADVADLRIGPAPAIGDGGMNGEPAVILTIMKQPSTNTLELTDAIDAAVAELHATLPADVDIRTDIFRQADFITASISNIRRVLLEGAFFVAVVLFLFLMNGRATFISLLAIPLSLLAAVLTLKVLGFTINTMSLGGMAIAIGDLVDDAIIDVENVFKRLRQNAALPESERRPTTTVIFDASFEIRSSVINATFIIIVAFIPLFFLSGMEGRLLAPLGVAFIVSLFASLLVSLTLTPVLCGYLLSSDRVLRVREGESALVRFLQEQYRRTLEAVLPHRRALVGVCIALFGLTGFLATGLGRSFLPEFNEGSLVVSVVTLPGVSLDESVAIATEVERRLHTIPEIRVTTRRTGRAELDEHAQGVNASEVDAPFVLGERSRAEFLAHVREELATVRGAAITIGQPIGHRIDHMLSGTRANIAMKIFGPDLQTLHGLANRVRDAVDGIEGLVDLSVEQQIEIPQLQIRADRERLNRYGLQVGDLNRFVEAAVGGAKVADVYEGPRVFDLVVRYDRPYRDGIGPLRDAWMQTADGTPVPLREVADVVSTSGPNTINRENVERKTVVSANVAGRDQRSVVEEIQARVAERVILPEGYRIEYGGQFEAEEQASRTLLVTSLLAILAIYLLLQREFRSPVLAGIILLNLPLALIGGVMSLVLTGGVLSIPAIIGFITLFGIATRNGILLVSHYDTLRGEGMNLRDTVVRGSIDRLSPILMTALTAGLALIPLALAGDQPGNEIQSPMAKVILGGLITSTALNLLVVPAVYDWVFERKFRRTDLP